ncbi:hypothetical protein DC20_01200 [Rufibacter tibetensis]|uniref:Tat pathway signal sequence domain protein n=1 Tax=Rufibacter tibetensis TaxID=512763 RepID=A0A0P0C785_9BACT|nr:hypothetical protein DC20_01200 [Rufibacter tibetensis]
MLLCFSFCFGVVFPGLAQKGKAQPVDLKWLHNQTIHGATGVSWGVPWPKGTVKKGQQFYLTNAAGKVLPLQAWSMAYWPDGSLKWTGFATVAGPENNGLKLNLGKAQAPREQEKLQLKETGKSIRIHTGNLQCVVPKNGSFLLDSLVTEGRMVGSRGRLECVLQNGPDREAHESPTKDRYLSKVEKVTVEQTGPVRAVVRVEGKLQAEKGQRTWLPFSTRLYFYAGSNAVRIVNTLIYDGNDQQDFIKGLAVVFSVPMREQMHNRHVRFSGEGPGIWAEPVKPLVGRRPVNYQGKNVFADQVAGKRIANQEEFAAPEQKLIQDFPIWNDYKLMQNNADGFNIQKRTNTKSTWLDAIAGKRATGLAFVGDVQGGLAIGLKDFWQSYPAALEVRYAAKSMAELKVWLWSPYAEAMDMRHYDTLAHGLEATYEDVQEGFSTPYGIARTSELTLFASANVPSNEELSSLANISSQTPLLVTTPEYLHSVNTFGVWSLPDRSTSGKRWIEEQLDKAITFYQKEIDQRNWYGFWNYGDVMHAYDPVRHTWRYDIGGFAWANTELAPDMWLWYSFLRTGRADIFKMAEAMTRHTSEVDVYHIGRMAGLGSRHNVRHWGDGSKEVRESQAPYRRFYYYLTTDERTGDMMREVAQTADKALVEVDPLRLILPKSQYPTHSRIGPDWLALVGNWMTEWERTGDKRWRDKIMAGVNSFAKMPYGFFSGNQGAFGYDPATQKMHMLSNDAIGSAHLTVLMGGPEVAFELTDLLQDKTWNRLWLQYSELYGASEETIEKALGKRATLGSPGPHFARLPAYASKMKQNPELAKRAWAEFLHPRTAEQFDPKLINGVQAVKPLEEVPGVSTNNIAQWCLNAIQLLELVGDQIPAQNELWNSADKPKK